MAKVYSLDLFGKRKDKFEFLDKASIGSIKWKELDVDEEYAFFTAKDFSSIKNYEKGFKVESLFANYNSGVESQKDTVAIQFSEENMLKVVNDFKTLLHSEVKTKYQISDTRDWSVENAKVDLNNAKLTKIQYRPFDNRFTMYSGKAKSFLAYPRNEIMQHMLKDNLGLITKRGFDGKSQPAFISKDIIDRRSWSAAGMQGAESLFPLYIYNDDGSRTSNFKPEIANKIYDIVGQVTPENILDYIYAVLYSPSYREKYKEFLKIDFPRVPYPKDKETFMKLASLGEKIRGLHLMTSPDLNKDQPTFNGEGDSIVEKVKYEDGKVYINQNQYFEGVDEIAWNFYIGGYQPAQKWLKDRKGRELDYDDIQHYKRIVVALRETDGLMKEIDKLNFNS